MYRLVTDQADHYFLMNDQPEPVAAKLDTGDFKYSAIEDPVEQTPLELGAPIDIPSHSARWVRMLRS